MRIFVLFCVLFFSTLLALWQSRRLFSEVEKIDPSFLKGQNDLFKSLLIVKSQFFWIVLFGNHKNMRDIKLRKKLNIWRIIFILYIVLFVIAFILIP